MLRVNEQLFNNSPFSLSGGQKRRVAISGILAFNPQVLVFDEPTVGLDPAGEKEILVAQTPQNAASMVTIFQHNPPKSYPFLFNGKIPSWMCPKAEASEIFPHCL